jgi:hypothetical protein
MEKQVIEVTVQPDPSQIELFVKGLQLADQTISVSSGSHREITTEWSIPLFLDINIDITI